MIGLDVLDYSLDYFVVGLGLGLTHALIRLFSDVSVTLSYDDT